MTERICLNKALKNSVHVVLFIPPPIYGQIPLILGISGIGFSLYNDPELMRAITLQRKSDICIPRNETERPHYQFPYLCICERFIYSQERIGPPILLEQNRQTDPGNILYKSQPRPDPRGMPGLLQPPGPADTMQRLALMMAVMVLGMPQVHSCHASTYPGCCGIERCR